MKVWRCVRAQIASARRPREVFDLQRSDDIVCIFDPNRTNTDRSTATEFQVREPALRKALQLLWDPPRQDIHGMSPVPSGH